MRFGKSLSGTLHLILLHFRGVCQTVLGEAYESSKEQRKRAICAPRKYFTSRTSQLLKTLTEIQRQIIFPWYDSAVLWWACQYICWKTSAPPYTPPLPNITSSRLGPPRSPSSSIFGRYDWVSLNPRSVCVGCLGLPPASHPFLFPPDGRLWFLG